MLTLFLSPPPAKITKNCGDDDNNHDNDDGDNEDEDEVSNISSKDIFCNTKQTLSLSNFISDKGWANSQNNFRTILLSPAQMKKQKCNIQALMPLNKLFGG